MAGPGIRIKPPSVRKAMNNLRISQPPAQGKYYPSTPLLQCLCSRFRRGPWLHMNVVADLPGRSKSMIFGGVASDEAQPGTLAGDSLKPQAAI